MRLLFDRTKDNLESKIAEEVYLNGYIFWRLHKRLDFENIETLDLDSESYLDSIIDNTVKNLDCLEGWDPVDEVNSWKACVLRDIVVESYKEWERIMDNYLYQPSAFFDGVPCMLIESIAEKGNEAPNELNRRILDVKSLFLIIKATNNSLILEINEFLKLKHKLERKHPKNDFITKRIQQKKNKLSICQYITLFNDLKAELGSIIDLLSKDEKCVIDKFIRMLSNISHTLNMYLIEEFSKEPLLTIDKWSEELVCKQSTDFLSSNYKWKYNEIINKLSVVVKLMYVHTVKNEDVFQQRNELFKEFIKTAIDEEKCILLDEFRQKKTIQN